MPFFYKKHGCKQTEGCKQAFNLVNQQNERLRRQTKKMAQDALYMPPQAKSIAQNVMKRA